MSPRVVEAAVVGEEVGDELGATVGDALGARDGELVGG